MMSKYAVLFEKSRTGYSAFVPDLPICFAAGRTLKDAERLIRGAIDMHIEAIVESGEPLPEPTTFAEMVDVATPKGLGAGRSGKP